MHRVFLTSLLLLLSCQNSNVDKTETQLQNTTSVSVNRIEQYQKLHPDSKKKSVSLGTVGNGKLRNGKLMPFSGENFQYFDTTSYVSDRAFVHEKVRSAALGAYKELSKSVPDRKFFLMECSHEAGGRLIPHFTHQNGMSIDFMSPVLKNNQPYYGIDTIGIPHYWLDFDASGKYSGDKSVSIDFDLIAQHILALDNNAGKNGLRIQKVILKMELHDEFFKTPNGKKVKQRGIYFAQKLTPLVNSVHDDHYHVDFELK